MPPVGEITEKTDEDSRSNRQITAQSDYFLCALEPARWKQNCPPKSGARWETAMLEAVPIDIALWGMIVCLAIKTAQWIAIAF
jgi:hypothetical protein